MSNQVNHDIMNQNVIDREELINYLTYLLENDGEVDKFFVRNNLEIPTPDILGFRDWLRDQTFDTIIRESYFEDYTKDLYQDTGDYDAFCFLHRHINWENVCEDLLETDYDRLFNNDEYHPFNIFKEEFYYHNEN